MANKRGRRSFRRKAPQRSYRKLFIIATEGAKTEPTYFSMFHGGRNAVIRIKLLGSSTDSAPKQVLSRARMYVQDESLRRGDEVWLVIDKDSWNDKQLIEVFQECKKRRYFLAVSNPCFEYWLLLHFENGRGVTGARDCIVRLKKHLPNFSKDSFDPMKFRPHVKKAIGFAEEKDRPPCSDWPRSNGTTVYRLVKKLLEHE